MNLNNPKTLDEAIEIIKEICPEHEETNTGKAEAMVLCAVKDEELVDKHKFCDFIRDRMTSMIDPMRKESESLPRGTYYRRWIELYWWLDHFCEHEPPKWGDEEES